MNHCSKCGSENKEQARFCAKCGENLVNPILPADTAPPISGTSQQDAGTIRFHCPSCNQTLEAPPVMAGEETACPACGKPFLIPISQQGTLTGARSAARGTRKSQAAAVRPSWKRRPVVFALLAILLVLGISIFLVPELLPGTVKKPPHGWVEHYYQQTGSLIYLPREWKQESDEYRASTVYGIPIDSEFMALFVKERGENGFRGTRPIDGAIVMEFYGWEGSDELNAKGVKRFLKDNIFVKQPEAEKDGWKFISEMIHKVAGGTASEVIADHRDTRHRIVMLVAKNRVGAEQVVKISCWADKNKFEAIDAQVFRPMIKSFVYCESKKEEGARHRSK